MDTPFWIESDESKDNFGKVVKVWQDDGYEYAIWQHPWGHYCGYVYFTEKPVKEDGYGGILTWVQVHGGITYAEPVSGGGIVYGFDCNHGGDKYRDELRDIDWLVQECVKLKDGILRAATFEDQFLAAENEWDVIDEMVGPVNTQELGLGQMISLLSGSAR